MGKSIVKSGWQQSEVLNCPETLEELIHNPLVQQKQ